AAGQGQKHLFAHDIVQLKAALLIIADFGLIGTNGMLARRGIHRLRPEDQIEFAAQGRRNRLNAAGAELGKVSMPVRAQPNVGHLLLVTAVLDDQVCPPANRERPHLGHVRSIVQRARGNGFIEEERLFLKLKRGNQHNLRVGLRSQEINGEGRQTMRLSDRGYSEANSCSCETSGGSLYSRNLSPVKTPSMVPAPPIFDSYQSR